MSDFDELERAQVLKEPGMKVHRSRRARPRTPAGTYPVHDHHGRLVSCIPISDARHPSDDDVLAAQLLERDVIAPILRASQHGSLVEDVRLQALEGEFHVAFGSPPKTAAWVGVFMSELEVGRQQWFAAELGDTKPGPEHRIRFAEAVVARSRRALSQSGLKAELPRWLSVRLSALLLQKFSFGRGGGPLGALSKESMGQLLTDPTEMLEYLRSFPECSRFSEELALLAEEDGASRGIST